MMAIHGVSLRENSSGCTLQSPAVTPDTYPGTKQGG